MNMTELGPMTISIEIDDKEPQCMKVTMIAERRTEKIIQVTQKNEGAEPFLNRMRGMIKGMYHAQVRVAKKAEAKPEPSYEQEKAALKP